MNENLLEAPDESRDSTAMRPPFGVRDVLYLLFRHKTKIVVCFLAGLAGAAGLAWKTEKIYRSEASLLVRFISDSVAVDPNAAGQQLVGGRTWDNVFGSELIILGSRSLAERVVDALGAEPLLASLPDGGRGLSAAEARACAIALVEGGFGVDVPGRSNVIALSYDAPEPALAQRVLQALLDAYLEMHSTIHRSAGSLEFLAQQTERIRDAMVKKESELNELKKKNSVASVDEAKEMASARVGNLRIEIGRIEAEIAAKKARVEALGAKIADHVETSGTDQPVESVPRVDVSSAQERLSRLRAEEANLLDRYTTNSVPVREIRRQIADTLALIGSGGPQPMATSSRAPDAFQNQVQASLIEEQSQLPALVAQVAALREQLIEATRESEKLVALDGSIKDLERELTIRNASYQKFSASLEQARVEDALQNDRLSNISVVQPPSRPDEVTWPFDTRKILAVLFAGLLLGLGLAIGDEYFLDRSIRRTSEAEAILNEPVLVSVPRVERAGWRRLRARRPGEEPLVAESQANAEEMKWNVNDAIRHQYELLGERVHIAMGDAHRLPYVLGVTSCNTGEGVSTLTAGLALTLARSMNGHVLLVDANMHRARKPKLYSEDKLSTSLVHLKGDGQGNTLILQPNLYMMQTTDVSGEMVTTKPAVRVDALVDSIRQNSSYACIILDMPPVMESALTARAASRCDSVVMVVEAERTHREVAIKAKKLLSQSGARLLGVVLNKHRHYVPKWLYTAC